MSDSVRVALLHRPGAEVVPLLRMLGDDHDISVVWHSVAAGAAAGLARAAPELIVVEVDGSAVELALVETIMATQPTPIVLLARQADSGPVLRLLAAGALEVAVTGTGADEGARVRHLVRTLARVSVVRRRQPRERAVKRAGAIVGIAASTGGPEALATLLGQLGEVGAPVLVVQHIHAAFLDGFVDWMDAVSPLSVQAAVAGLRIDVGHVYIAPNNFHLGIGKDNRLCLETPAERDVHVPSANALFRTMADAAGQRGIGVVLSGMGDDGAVGLVRMHEAGGHTIAQDETSSTVFGMARAAVRLAAIDEVLPLADIAAAVCRAVRRVNG